MKVFSLTQAKACICKLMEQVQALADQIEPIPVYNEVPEYEYYTIYGEDGGTTNGNGLLYSYGNGDVGNIGFRVQDGSELISSGFNADFGGLNDSVDIEIVDLQDLNNITVIHTHSVVGSGDGTNNNTHTYEDFRATPVPIPNGAVLGLRIANETGVYSSHRFRYEFRTPTGRTLLTP